MCVGKRVICIRKLCLNYFSLKCVLTEFAKPKLSIFMYHKYLKPASKNSFLYKITICVGDFSIQKGYFVVENLVLNVGIKFIRFTNKLEFYVPHINLSHDNVKPQYFKPIKIVVKRTFRIQSMSNLCRRDLNLNIYIPL